MQVKPASTPLWERWCPNFVVFASTSGRGTTPAPSARL